jgi:cyclase
MQRSAIFSAWILGALLLTAGIPVLTAQDFSQYQIVATPLSDNVTWLRGAGGNMAACSDGDGMLLVDAEYAQMSDKVKDALTELGDQPLAFVINTHWHFDHVGGNAILHEAGAIIVAHANVRKAMASDQHIDIIDHDEPAAPRAALPAITFTDSLIFHLNGEEIAVIHVPHAHTDGDAIVHFRRANVIHSGDIVFNCGYPFIDVSHGGHIDGVIAAVKTILSLCDDETQIVPGHGPLARKTDLETYLGMLQDFRNAIAGEIAAGKDLETIKAAKATAVIDAKWGDKMFPPELFTEMVYRSLKGP